MRLIFAGTPEFAARALAALVSAGHEVALVLTQPDRPAGRGMKAEGSPVKRLALEYGLPLLQPPSLKNPDILGRLAAEKADVMVVAAYGLMLPEQVLTLPRYGCLNIHASLLPCWRGAAPIQRALLAGDTETGITIMQMDRGLDTGAMLLTAPLPIGERDTAQTLHDRLAELGAQTIVRALALLQKGALIPQPQDEAQASYAAKLSKAEGRLDWRRPAAELARAVRAYNSFPVARAVLAGETWRIWQARPVAGPAGRPGEIVQVGPEGIAVACGEGALLLEEVQKAGGKRLPVARFLPGNPVGAGQVFEVPA